MADVEIKYNNATIASLNDSGTEVFETSGTFLTDDITVEYTKSGGGGGVTMVSVDISLLTRKEMSSPWVYSCLVDGSSTVALDENYNLIVSCPENSMFVIATEIMPPSGSTGTVTFTQIYSSGMDYYYAVFAGASGGSIYSGK